MAKARNPQAGARIWARKAGKTGAFRAEMEARGPGKPFEAKAWKQGIYSR